MATTSRKSGKPSRARMSLSAAMDALEAAGSEQTRKTYARHGAKGPMFGVSFATLKAMTKAIGVDHELARALWATGNLDARNLAVKVADPAAMTPADLDAWAGDEAAPRACSAYVAMLAAEGPHALKTTKKWLASKDVRLRVNGWAALGQLALRDESLPEAWLQERLAEIETTIHAASNAEREVLNAAVIAIGCRDARFRKLATAAARRIGKVEIDYGDTACKTPDAAASIEKAWAHSLSKGFASPAAHERSREVLRIRC